jgi:hypothetical protein
MMLCHPDFVFAQGGLADAGACLFNQVANSRTDEVHMPCYGMFLSGEPFMLLASTTQGTRRGCVIVPQFAGYSNDRQHGFYLFCFSAACWYLACFSADSCGVTKIAKGQDSEAGSELSNRQILKT